MDNFNGLNDKRARSEDATRYKRMVAILARNSCNHIKADGRTWSDTENACRKNKLYPAVYIQCMSALGIDIIKGLNK